MLNQLAIRFEDRLTEYLW